jgi:hypothetical protein
LIGSGSRNTIRYENIMQLFTRIWHLPSLIGLAVCQLWAAHALAFFLHEYAHSTVAWLLGWKANPLDLDYAHPTPIVLLFQLGINQKVDEAPIFASGHGFDAGLIAAAGVVVGNAIVSLGLARWGWQYAIANGKRGWAMLAYWVTAASVGNLLSYVPLRVFVADGDVFSIVRGFEVSPWAVLVVLGIPTFAALAWFVFDVAPKSLERLWPDRAAARVVTALFTAAFVFGFYGLGGLLEDDLTAHLMGQICIFGLAPLAAIIEIALVLRGPQSAEANPVSLESGLVD